MNTSFCTKSCRRNILNKLLVTCILSGSVLLCSNSSSAQLVRGPLSDGFQRTSSIDMTVDEMLGPKKPRAASSPILGPGYPSLWIAEVQYKPIRHRLMPVMDAGTGQSKTELVWYLVYRVIIRDYTDLAGENRDALRAKLDNVERNPSNQIDEQLVAPLILPRFVLRLDDDATATQYVDEVNPEIQKAVLAREFDGETGNRKLLNSISGIQEISEAVTTSDPLADPLKDALYGVAVWRNVDPDTDYFTVFMSGFSNAYQIHREDGALIVQQKVIEQRFGRPGDRFRQEESEFRFLDGARLRTNGTVEVSMEGVVSSFRTDRPAPAFVDQLRQQMQESESPEIRWPHWIYQQREAELTVPQMESVLRHTKSGSAKDAKANPSS